jgi:hypothetical protein
MVEKKEAADKEPGTRAGRRYAVAMGVGFLLGALVLHPFSMVFQDLVHPELDLRPALFLKAFSVHHIHMALFFGVLGAAFAAVVALNLSRLSRERVRVRQLERLLPICSYCKKIRDEHGDETRWTAVEHYIAERTDTDFTHGICPECYRKVMAELDEEDEQK